MQLSTGQMASLNKIEEYDMRAAAFHLLEMECEVLTPSILFRIGTRHFSMRDLVALCMANCRREDGKALRSSVHTELGIIRYQQVVGVTPLTLFARQDLCAHPTNREDSLAMAKEIVSWSRVAKLENVKDNTDRDETLEEAAHLLLRWVENCKCRILGIDPNGRQLMLSLWGITGAFKTSTAKALLRPLGSLMRKTSAPEHLFLGHEGVQAGQYVALWFDEFPKLSKQLVPYLKDFVTSPKWRANPKNKDAQEVDMLASLIATHNPPPTEMFPDSAMQRRLGIINYPTAMDEVRGFAFVDDVINKFDMTAFWRAVDPVNRASSDIIVARSKKRMELVDTFEMFMSECAKPVKTSNTLLGEFYNVFRTRAAAGGWDVRGWTDKTVAARLRGLGFELRKSAKGLKIQGIELVDYVYDSESSINEHNSSTSVVDYGANSIHKP